MVSEPTSPASTTDLHAQKPHRHHAHDHDHHHTAPRAFPGRSMLALSAWQRLALATPIITVLWLMTYWALHHG